MSWLLVTEDCPRRYKIDMWIQYHAKQYPEQNIAVLESSNTTKMRELQTSTKNVQFVQHTGFVCEDYISFRIHEYVQSVNDEHLTILDTDTNTTSQKTTKKEP